MAWSGSCPATVVFYFWVHEFYVNVSIYKISLVFLGIFAFSYNTRFLHSSYSFHMLVVNEEGAALFDSAAMLSFLVLFMKGNT
jgi:hypothetical protein